jgi:dTDP-glucose 4,6-dehydratase
MLDAFARGLLEPWSVGRITVLARTASQLRSTHPVLLGPRVELIDADVGTIDRLPPASLVIHAAASADASRYLVAPEAERHNILRAASHYARLARQWHPDSRILFASSGAVYGQQPATLDRLREDADPLLLESMAPGKRAYAAAKRDAEACFQALGRAGQRVAIARGFAFVGPWLPRDLHFAIGNFLADGLAGRPIRVQARHPVWRSYLHADDLVHWLMTLVSAAEPACPVVNVGSDQDYLLDDVARRVGAAFGLPAELPDMAAGPVDRYVPSIDRARERFGLRVTRSLDQAIEATIASTVRSA